LVEDDIDQQRMIKRRLDYERPGVRLILAGNGAEAKAALEAGGVDVAIIDYSLPDTTGLDLLAIIAAQPHPPAAVMVTAFNDTSIAVEAMKRGAQDFVIKGADYLRKLPLAIDRAFRTAHLNHRLQTLSEIARALVSTFDVEEVLRILGDRLLRVVRYNRILLKILQDDGASYDVRSIVPPSSGAPVEVETLEPVPASNDTPILRVASQGTPAVIEQVHNALMVEAGARQVAAFPVVADGRSMGVLAVGTDDEGFLPPEMELLEDLAAHLAIAVRNGRMYASLQTAYTELKQAREQLDRAQKLEAIGEMAAGVAHDFNNLLSAILGRAQMLKVQLADQQDAVDSITVIEEAALDGARTVARIQTFAKSKPDRELVRIDVDALVEQTITRAMSSVRANRKAQDVELVVALDCAGAARGNASELRQVLTNLIFNAVDAMARGGTLTIATGSEPDGVWIEVGDSGVGMDEETRTRMFNPFFTTKGTRGTGLGLSVSYGIIQRHGGEFVVRSQPNVGTTVRVQLPSGDTAEAPAPGPSVLAPPRPSSTSKTVQSARILVIDDDRAVLEVLADMLRTGNHDVAEACNGAEGLELFRKSEFDLVFTDLGMPGMNGWEVAAGIKAISPDTPVGLITGWGGNLDDEEMRGNGVDLIVSKPFRLNDVLELVTEAMELDQHAER